MKTNLCHTKKTEVTTWINFDASGKDIVVTHTDKNGLKTELYYPNFNPKEGIYIVPITREPLTKDSSEEVEI